MGGYNSGRPGWRRKAEHSLPVDVRRLARDGLVNPGTWGSLRWTNGYGEQVGTIGVTAVVGSVILSYTWTPYGGEAQSVQCSISLTSTPCNLGGSRVWFLCPECDARCAAVYFGARGGRYACRSCVNIAYAVQSEDEGGRLQRKQSKIERKLSAGGGGWNFRKPKRMHRTTFDRLRQEWWKVENERDRLIWPGVARLMKRLGVELP